MAAAAVPAMMGAPSEYRVGKSFVGDFAKETSAGDDEDGLMLLFSAALVPCEFAGDAMEDAVKVLAVPATTTLL
jgi:hypothetical protein